MRSYIRLHKTERTEGVRTLLNQQIRITTYTRRPMLFKIADDRGLLDLAEPASRVEIGGTYIRKGPNGTELVRRRQQSERTMNQRRQSRSGRRRLSYAQKDAAIRQRLEELHGELAARQQAERDQRRRGSLSPEERDRIIERELQRLHSELAACRAANTTIIDRESQPYHWSVAHQESNSPDISPRTRPTRQKDTRFAFSELNLDLDIDLDFRQHRHHPRHRDQSIYQEVDLEAPYYDMRSPQREYFVQEAFPEPPPRRHVRRYSRRRSYHQHEEAIVLQRVVVRERLPVRDPGPHRRHSGRIILQNNYDVEDRTPEDYWYGH